MSQALKHLPSKCEILSSNTTTKKKENKKCDHKKYKVLNQQNINQRNYTKNQQTKKVFLWKDKKKLINPKWI
jgi:hypothetical protein